MTQENSSSKDIYFLVQETKREFKVSPMMYVIADDDKSLELQLTRDIGWVFKLPTSGQKLKHILVCYTSEDHKTPAGHYAHVSELIRKQGLGQGVKIVHSWTIDYQHSSLLELKNQFTDFAQRIIEGDATEHLHGMSVHADHLTISEQNGSITYLVDFYIANGKAENIICLPTIKINR